jgi:PAS domain S-box-containing protein
MTCPPSEREVVSLSELVSQLGNHYIRGASATDIFAALLPDLQRFMHCEAAMVARLCDDTAGLHLQVYTSPSGAWAPPPPGRYSVCRNLHSLLGRVITSGRPLIDNQVTPHEAALGLPYAHPGVHQFMGIPLIHGGTLVGVLALVNHPTGFDLMVADTLSPAVNTLANIVGSVALERAQREALLAQTVAQDRLQRHEDHYRQIFEAAGVGIALISPQGHWLDLNLRFANICRRTRQELLQLRLQDITHAEDLTVDQALMEATLRGHRDHYSLDKRIVLPDGSHVWVQINTVLVRDQAGQPQHFVTVVEDISDRKRYQEALLTAQASERASKAKTEFLSRMSHELRTPLNAMLGFTQLLRVDKAHPLDDHQRQRLAHIEQAGSHLLAMLTEVLDLSRIEAGSLPLSLEALSLDDVITEALNLVGHQARQQDISITQAPLAEHIHVRADQLRLRQILVNLLSNGIKYNRPQGSVRVEVQSLKPHVIITVMDTGKGLSQDQMDHLFEPFNRLGAERSSIEGTGIGLVIVKRLVGLMHGRLEVQSAAGEGSTFRVILPWAAQPDADESARRAGPSSGFDLLQPPAGTTAETPRLGMRRLLYAEDNPINVELVRHVMRMCPHWELEIANNGTEAIAQTLKHPPDLLMLDMHLGDMTGLDVADALARHPHTASIPKVVLSADVMPDQRRAARDRGFLDYLTKPLDVARLMQLLAQREGAQPATEVPSEPACTPDTASSPASSDLEFTSAATL